MTTEEITFPDFLEIKDNIFGLGTYAKKPFKKGELVMRSRAKIISPQELQENDSNNNSNKNYSFEIFIQNKKYFLDKQKCTSFVKGKVYLFTLDAFINHSCEPNIFTSETYTKDDYFYYSKFALRDIKAGDELVTNYLFFENESDFEFLCKCESEYCFGVIKGKNHLDNDQLQRLNRQVL